MIDEQTVRNVLDNYRRGGVARGEVAGRLLRVLAQCDVDAQLALLSSDDRDWVLWELRNHYSPIVGNEPLAYSVLESVNLRPGSEDAYRRDLRRREEHLRNVAIPAIQDWLHAHPLPPREVFPAALVRGLLARIIPEREAVARSLTREEFRTHVRRLRLDPLLEIECELEAALRRAALAGIGSQEQALAWEGFDRVAPLLAVRADLTPDERDLVTLAHARREPNFDR